jgi:hypothetical protein
MSEESVMSLLQQMLVFISEQAPIFILVIAAVILVLFILWVLTKLGLTTPAKAQSSSPPPPQAVTVGCGLDETWKREVLAELKDINRSCKQAGDDINLTRETLVTLAQAAR